MKHLLIVLSFVGIAIASPIVKRDAPYPAALPHSTYGEPIRKSETFVKIEAPAVFDAPYPAPVEPATEYGPPPTIKESAPIVVEIPETPAEEYGPPPPTSFIAPPAPALPALPALPELIIPHIPETPKALPEPFPAVFDAPYPAPVEPAAEYGPPPAIKEALPIIVEEPAAEYGPPQTDFIAPAAPALPALPNLPETIIRHFPEAPKTIEAPLPAVFDAPYPAPVEPAAEYGPPPAIKEALPIIVEEPAAEYGPPLTNFIAPPAPALPQLPALPELVIPHFPEAPKAIAAPLPVATVFDAPYPAPHEEYGPPTTTTTTTTTTTLPPPPPTTTTTTEAPSGPYPAAGPVSHYGDPIQKSTPFFIRVNSKNKGFSFVQIGEQVVARNNKLLVDEGSFTYYDNNANPIHVKYHTNN